jgi:hypothetical protein
MNTANSGHVPEAPDKSLAAVCGLFCRACSLYIGSMGGAGTASEDLQEARVTGGGARVPRVQIRQARLRLQNPLYDDQMRRGKRSGLLRPVRRISLRCAPGVPISDTPPHCAVGPIRAASTFARIAENWTKPAAAWADDRFVEHVRRTRLCAARAAERPMPQSSPRCPRREVIGAAG